MKLIKQQLKQMIREELSKVLNEVEYSKKEWAGIMKRELGPAGVAQAIPDVAAPIRRRPSGRTLISARGDTPSDVAGAVEDALETIIKQKLDEFGVHKDDWEDWVLAVETILDSGD